MLTLVAVVLVIEPIFEILYQHFFCFQRMRFELSGNRKYQGLSVIERINYFHRRRQILFIILGVIILSILMGIWVFTSEDICFKTVYMVSLFCIVEPCIEILYYRWMDNRHYRNGMTAQEMTAYHNYIQRFHSHSLSLNGESRKRLRFVLLSFGIGLLMTLAFITLIP